jgi:hypothetical protein
MTTLTDSPLFEHDSVSPRSILANQILSFGKENCLLPSIRQVFRKLDAKERAYYGIRFETITVKVYSEKYFIVNFLDGFRLMPDRSSIVFKNINDLYEFLTAAFIVHSDERTIRSLEKAS